MRASVSIRDGISDELERIQDIPGALTTLAMIAAQVLVERAVGAFTRTNLRPSPWDERNDDEPHPLLQLSKALSQSLTAQAESNGAIIGSDRPYAAVHQLGSTKKNIPARPFFAFDADGTIDPAADRLVQAALRAGIAQIIGRGAV